jgi:murein DD-endopeptidase MepM/ murein hydrolase activator NlpD
MFVNKLITCQILSLCLLVSGTAQKSIPKDYFRAPIDIPLYLSGNFGELRSNHFHAGIDIKTMGVTGHKVYASAEGYISRIKIEAAGYGNTLYITHPAGFTTVYGHLERFRQDIASYVLNLQYENQQHAINIYPEKSRWPVKKGEFIALSGTSGYSYGPHLHYEIREAATQETMNVLMFGFNIEDKIPPKVYSLYVYPSDEKGLVNNSSEKLRLELSGENGIYKVAGMDTLELDGNVGFGIEAYDYLNGANNRCGLYSIRLFVDEKLKFHWEMDQFSFSESRYINSFIDYEEKGKNKKNVQKTFVDPNNQLSLYRYTDQAGIMDFSENRNYNISILIEDTYGNQSRIDFLAAGGIQNGPDVLAGKDTATVTFSCMSPHEFKDEGLELQLPQGALYYDLDFKYTRSEMLPGTFSPVHHLHDPYTPMHKDCKLVIKAQGIADSLQEKALFGILSQEGEILAAGGEWIDGNVVGQIRNLGKYTVIIDTIAPIISPLDTKHDMSDRKTIRFSVTDELSGIKSYEGYVDNKWALFEYDLKNDLVYYSFDASRISKETSHELELYIIDNKDNISYYYTDFYW